MACQILTSILFKVGLNKKRRRKERDEEKEKGEEKKREKRKKGGKRKKRGEEIEEGELFFSVGDHLARKI